MSAPHIGFLGLGIMGGGMARRLLGAGFSVAVFNRSRAKADALAGAGAKVADAPRAAAEGATIVFSMVGDDAASRQMWLGEGGALAGLARGATAVECSTLTIAWVRELAAVCAARGVEFVDAPVTGSKAAAASGELNFLAGGSASAVEKVRPALMAMGRTVTHFGPAGSGALVKLVNNFMAGVHVAACGEALAWLERSGVDREQALAFILEGAAASPVTKIVAGRMKAADFTPNFPLQWMAKDLGYAIKEAGTAGVPLVTAPAALEQFRRALSHGHGEKDMAAVVMPLRGDRPTGSP